MRNSRMGGFVAASVCGGLVSLGGWASVPATAHPAAAAPASRLPGDFHEWRPDPPRVFLDTTYRPPSGAVIRVGAGADLQAALDTVQPGQTLELQAGATFVGNFRLKPKPGKDWIHIRSSAYADLPAPETRVGPGEARLMPKIVTPNSEPALATQGRAHHMRFVGLEVAAAPPPDLTVDNLVWWENVGQTAVGQAPSDLVFDRSYLHGSPTGNVRRGILANSARTAVIDSWLSEFHEVGADSQAIAAYNTPGPLKIVNNHLAAAGENVLFGGAESANADFVPSDVEFRRNHLFKPLRWRTGSGDDDGFDWSVKNIFEIKNARRVLVDGNLMENVWLDSQNGFAVLLTVRGEGGSNPWNTVSDITVMNNVIRHAAAGFNLLGVDDSGPSSGARSILIENNLLDDVDGPRWGSAGGGTAFQISGLTKLVVNHNTVVQTGSTIVAYGEPTTDFVYTNNISQHLADSYGVIGDGTAPGTPTISTYFPQAVVARNVLAGEPLTFLIPPGTYESCTIAAVRFVDHHGGDGGNYRLQPTSPFAGAAIDGKDIGADFRLIFPK